MTFTEFCLANNIKLLKDDLKYIRRILEQLPKDHRAAILKQYADRWLEAMANEPNESLKNNKGRKAANEWLREYGKGRDNWDGKTSLRGFNYEDNT